MTIEYLLLSAAIQGITEFIPVSSSGHLVLVHKAMNGAENLANPVLDVALHFGTLIAVMVYFRQDTWQLARGSFDLLSGQKTGARDAALNMVWATLPVILAAALLLAGDMIEVLRQAEIVAWASILFAVPLYLADRFGPSDKPLAAMTARPALLMGLAQIFALIPGASRAGVTMTAGRALGFSREAAARYSMHMAMPVILAFALLGLLELIVDGRYEALGTAFIGAVLAAIFAFFTIDVFLKMTRRLSLWPFVIYRISLGLAILAIL